jgi:hypothetical protein
MTVSFNGSGSTDLGQPLNVCMELRDRTIATYVSPTIPMLKPVRIAG